MSPVIAAAKGQQSVICSDIKEKKVLHQVTRINDVAKSHGVRAHLRG